MFRNHEILINQEEVLEALLYYNFQSCICTEEFVSCLKSARESTKNEGLMAMLIAAGLLVQYDVLETRKEGRTHRLYGHDEDGKKHLLLVTYAKVESF